MGMFNNEPAVSGPADDNLDLVFTEDPRAITISGVLVVTDDGGTMWIVDPTTGIARRVKEQK